MDSTCFDECFLFRVITRRHSFLYKLIITQKFGVTAMLLRSLKQVFWKKSVFYIHYFHNNITMLLIPQCFYVLHVVNNFLRIWSHLLKKSLMENIFVFWKIICAVWLTYLHRAFYIFAKAFYNIYTICHLYTLEIWCQLKINLYPSSYS